jgi:hypothetical protein
LKIRKIVQAVEKAELIAIFENRLSVTELVKDYGAGID